MLKSILYFIASLVIFFSGVIVYGILLNTREVTLAEALAARNMSYVTNVHLRVDRRNFKLELYSDTVLVKTYKAVFGRDNSHRKKLCDTRGGTPAGTYEICEIDTNSPYRKFLRLNYPNYQDIADAFRSGQISQHDYDQYYEEIRQGGYGKTPLLRKVNMGIQGMGRLNFIFKNLPFVYNWTDGSIAVSDESINEIYSVTKVGTQVVIKN